MNANIYGDFQIYISAPLSDLVARRGISQAISSEISVVEECFEPSDKGQQL